MFGCSWLLTRRPHTCRTGCPHPTRRRRLLRSSRRPTTHPRACPACCGSGDDVAEPGRDGSPTVGRSATWAGSVTVTGSTLAGSRHADPGPRRRGARPGRARIVLRPSSPERQSCLDNAPYRERRGFVSTSTPRGCPGAGAVRGSRHGHASGTGRRRKPLPGRTTGLALFLGLVGVFEAIFASVLVSTGNLLWIYALMWSVALSSVITRMVRREGFADVSFRFGGRRTWESIGFGVGRRRKHRLRHRLGDRAGIVRPHCRGAGRLRGGVTPHPRWPSSWSGWRSRRPSAPSWAWWRPPVRRSAGAVTCSRG